MSQLANISSAVAPPPDNQRSAPGFWRRLMRSRAGLLSLIVVVLVVLAALAGPWLYPVDATRTDFGTINAAPSRTHPLGTDRLGHDTLARLLAGLRVSLLVALVVELINIGLGGALGLLAGYFGGWVDTLIARVADMVFAFPGLLLAILVAAVFGQWVTENYGSTARLVLVAASISLVGWPLMARYVRGQTLSLRERDFVLAARAIGQSELGILRQHILPNVAGLVITAATLDVVNAIVGEATLSLLGLGIQSPATSIGKMIVEATPLLGQNSLLVFVPAATLTLLVLAFSFLGDGLRQALDPGNR
ncbi:MAG: ABC transporter permease [Kouleothrix sp.]|jgi:ABC-type dipeptide/oligopeptide/nickel transport system permease subunit|nr:ABC transporter permease [Kouleothrix sp.]